MLMRKLPEENLKRKWAYKAGDLIKAKGRAEYADFVEFVRRIAERVNNRYGQELKLTTTCTEKYRNDPPKSKPDQRYKVTTLATSGKLRQVQRVSYPASVLDVRDRMRSGDVGQFKSVYH